MVAAAGTIANLAAAIAAFWLLGRRTGAPAWRYFLWLFGSINLLNATAYFLYSGILGFRRLGRRDRGAGAAYPMARRHGRGGSRRLCAFRPGFSESTLGYDPRWLGAGSRRESNGHTSLLGWRYAVRPRLRPEPGESVADPHVRGRERIGAMAGLLALPRMRGIVASAGIDASAAGAALEAACLQPRLGRRRARYGRDLHLRRWARDSPMMAAAATGRSGSGRRST